MRVRTDTSSKEDSSLQDVLLLGQDESSPFKSSEPLLKSTYVAGYGEKFNLTESTGTGTLTIPIPVSLGRDAWQPQLFLEYSPGKGNSAFGLDWDISIPQIYRRTSKGIPVYDDEIDVFVYSGGGDLVPKLGPKGSKVITADDTTEKTEYILGTAKSPLRIEKLVQRDHAAAVSWRIITGDNTTHIFGSTSTSQIYDEVEYASSGRKNIYSWLLDASYDAHGNAKLYSYMPENDDGVDRDLANEENRQNEARRSNRHITAIRYGNIRPNRDMETWEPFHPSRLNDTNWLFEVVFDYGQFPSQLEPATTSKANGSWSCRPDPFSMYRSGFEIRNYRICSRIIMFHHFPAELGRQDVVVGAMELAYTNANGFNTLKSVRRVGYRESEKTGQASFLEQLKPPLCFIYTPCVADMEPVTGQLPATHFSQQPSQFVDLNNSGASGIFSRCSKSWYFQPNPIESGSDSFDDRCWVPVDELPAHTLLSGSLSNIDGSGLVNFANLIGTEGGLYPGSQEGKWDSFRAFQHGLAAPPNNMGALQLDLTGDGLGDILLASDDTVTWIQSQGQAGFAEARLSFLGPDERAGPRFVASDPQQAIFLADMSGDGLLDLVRIRNTEVSYWPNMGFGKFARRITMSHSPILDNPSLFSSHRVLMEDIDGTGCSDLVYCPASGGVMIFFNLSGNSWSEPLHIAATPPLDSASDITYVDILGTGSRCVVWNSIVSDHLFYIDLSRGIRPRLLEKFTNGYGLETSLSYTYSAKFAAKDARKGSPWKNKVSTSLHCVSRVDTHDVLRKSTSVQCSSYGDAYFDAINKEFRGFGSVEIVTWDEAVTDPSQSQPNDTRLLVGLKTILKTWYHTGDVESVEEIVCRSSSSIYESCSQVSVNPVLEFSDDAAPADVYYGLRSLRGSCLRKELYMDDGTDRSAIPIHIISTSHFVKQIQPGTEVAPAAFSIAPCEITTVILERIDDGNPRVTRTISLSMNDYLNGTSIIKIQKGRSTTTLSLASPDPDIESAQTRSLVTFTENTFTEPVIGSSMFQAPRVAQTSTYQVTGLNFDVEINSATMKGLLAEVLDMTAVPFESDMFTASGISKPAKRLFSQSQVLYAAEDLQTALNLGQCGSHGLVWCTLRHALPGSLATDTFSDKVKKALENETFDAVMRKAGYVGDGTRGWWAPSSTPLFVHPSEANVPGQGITKARGRFYRPVGSKDQWGNQTILQDDKYSLFVIETTSPLLHRESRVYDYLALKPSLCTDENRNETHFIYDAFGNISSNPATTKEKSSSTRTAALGITWSEDDSYKFLTNPVGVAISLLGGSVCRTIRDPNAFAESGSPTWEAKLTCTSYSKTEIEKTDVQITITYLDGTLKPLQTKTWVGWQTSEWHSSAWSVCAPHGLPVKQFEPFFSEMALPEISPRGLSTTRFWDALYRPCGSLDRQHGWRKITRTAWTLTMFDEGDLALVADPGRDSEMSSYFLNLCDPSEYMPSRNATHSADALSLEQDTVYSNTPTIKHLNPAGKCLAIEHTDGLRNMVSYTLLDVQGQPRAYRDPRGIPVAFEVYDMIGNVILQRMSDSGSTVKLPNVIGCNVYRWDNSGSISYTQYDEQGRKSMVSWSRDGSFPKTEIISYRYGDDVEGATEKNIVGRLYEVRDQAGVRICIDPVQWEDVTQERNLGPLVTTKSSYDLQNRLSSTAIKDNASVYYTYNQLGLLSSVNVQPGGARRPIFQVIEKVKYDPWKRVTDVAYGNGIAVHKVYDPLSGRLMQRTAIRDHTLLEDTSYTHDIMGNILSSQNSVIMSPPKNNGKSRLCAFEYDAFDRLVHSTITDAISTREDPSQDDGEARAKIDANYSPENIGAMLRPLRHEQTFTYDDSNNISSTTTIQQSGLEAQALTTRSEYAFGTNSNRLVSRLDEIGAGEASRQISYDGNGNTSNNGNGTDMLWDSHNQLVMATCSDEEKTIVSRFAYNEAGERCCKIVDSDGKTVDRRQYFSNGVQLRETVEDGKSTRQVIQAVRLPPKMALTDPVKFIIFTLEDQNPAIFFHFQDHLDSVLFETNEKGDIVSTGEFSAYGATIQERGSQPGSLSKTYGFNGKEMDSSTGLLYYGRRYYDSSPGRWISPDPTGIRDGLNLYGYVGGNPINYRDPDGTMEAPPADDKSEEEQEPFQLYLFDPNSHNYQHFGPYSDEDFRAHFKEFKKSYFPNKAHREQAFEAYINNNKIDLAEQYYNWQKEYKGGVKAIWEGRGKPYAFFESQLRMAWLRSVYSSYLETEAIRDPDLPDPAINKRWYVKKYERVFGDNRATQIADDKLKAKYVNEYLDDIVNNDIRREYASYVIQLFPDGHKYLGSKLHGLSNEPGPGEKLGGRRPPDHFKNYVKERIKEVLNAIEHTYQRKSSRSQRPRNE